MWRVQATVHVTETAYVKVIAVFKCRRSVHVYLVVLELLMLFAFAVDASVFIIMSLIFHPLVVLVLWCSKYQAAYKIVLYQISGDSKQKYMS